MKILKVTRLPKDKDRQVEITVRCMIQLTCAEAWQTDVRWLATHWRLPHYNREEIADAYTHYIREKVGFELDPEDIELVRTASYYARALRAGQPVTGDCDDMALLLGTLLFSQGFSLAYVVISTSPVKREFQHVFVRVYFPRGYLPGGYARDLDPSVSTPYSTDGLRRKIYRVPWGAGPPAL